MTYQQSTHKQTIEQERGRHAWQNVLSIKNDPRSLQKEYRSLARGLNAMIQINGLGQTLGFLKAKGKNDPTAVRGSLDPIHENGRSILIWQRMVEKRKDQVRNEAVLPRFTRACSESGR